MSVILLPIDTHPPGRSLILIQQFIGQGIEPGLMRNILTNTPLKITGVGTLSSYEKVMASQQVDREGFIGLRPRLFHVSRRGSQPFVTEAHGFLAGSEERMTQEEQAAFAASQLDRYYRPPHPDASEDRTEADGVTVVRNIPPEEFTPPRASEGPPEASRFPGSGGIAPLPSGERDSAAQAAVRRALGQTATPVPDRPPAADHVSPRRRGRKQQAPPVPTGAAAVPPQSAEPPASPATPALGSVGEAGPEHPDGGQVPKAELAPEVFKSRRQRPKYPAS